MTGGPPLSIYVVAGEESGDLLGAALMRALRRLDPDIRFAGVGGRHMAGEGIVSPFPIEQLSIVGIGVIARKLPLILRRIRETAAAIVVARPDALVIIDSPDFTHRVARRVRAAAPKIPIVNYAPPSVWAWRPWRAKAMRAYVDEALAILPFEPAAHETFGGPPCTYVGHPLAERLGDLRPDAEDERRRNAAPPRLLVLPGSRGSEIRRLAAPFGAAIGEVAARVGALDLVLPTLPHIAAQVTQATADWPVRPRIVTDVAEKYAAFRTARAALAASGTVTLELALAGVPMVAAYRVPAWEGLLVRALAHVNTVILANLVLGANVVPEYLQRDCTPERIAAGLVPLFADTPERRRQVEAFARLDAVMDLGGPAPSARAAARVRERIGLRSQTRFSLPSAPRSC
jgi:lipid-A-disaccharide synthase